MLAEQTPASFIAFCVRAVNDQHLATVIGSSGRQGFGVCARERIVVMRDLPNGP